MRPGQRIEVGFNVPASKSVFGQSNFLNTHTTYECQKGAIRITLSSGEIDNCSHSFMQVSCMFRSKLKRKDTCHLSGSFNVQTCLKHVKELFSRTGNKKRPSTTNSLKNKPKSQAT